MREHRPEYIFPWRTFKKKALLQSSIILIAIALSGIVARYFFKRNLMLQTQSELHALLTLLAHSADEQNVQWCSRYAKNTPFRLTLVLPNGQVICDSHHDARTMDSHASRTEVVQALEHGFGYSVRFSSTVSEDMFYGAFSLPQRAVLRVALPLSHISWAMTVWDVSLISFLALIAACLVGFTLWTSRSLVFPLGRLLLKTKGAASGAQPLDTDEWKVLEKNIDYIQKDLATKTQRLSIERFELETIMAAISDAILAVDVKGTPLFFNSRFELLFHGTRLKNPDFKLWEIFRNPEILNTFDEALKLGKMGFIKAAPISHNGGLKRFFSLSVSPLRKEGGSIYGAVGIFHDVTDLKTAEQMRIDFVANVSHELRTPVTSIKGFADTLTQDVKDGKPANVEFLTTMTRNIERLMNLMNDLLDLSSIEAADILQKEFVRTEEVTTRVVKQLQSAFESKKQTIETSFEASSVNADSHRLEQVLMNLLHNAHKYTPAGGHVRLSWTKTGDDVLLKVADTGPGLAPEHQRRIFERFYRVDKARSRDQGGTGLGLAIVKHIMQRHQGAVWVESEVGHGTTFFCQFPP